MGFESNIPSNGPSASSGRRNFVPPFFLHALMAIAAVALLISIVLPAINQYRWRQFELKARRCPSHESHIALSAIVYATKHGRGFPDDLATIYEAEGRLPEAFLCPFTASRAASGLTTRAIAEQLRKGIGIDDVYVGRGLTMDEPNDTVILYEPLSNHDGEGMNVCFADGHVEWEPAADAQPILQQAAAGVRPIRYPTTIGATSRPSQQPQ